MVPAFEDTSVKAFFPVDRNQSEDMKAPDGEHMYVKDISTDGKTVFGTLNNDPHQIRWIKDGDSVSFPISRLSDWFLVPHGKGPAMGGFTVDVLKRQMDPQELKEYEQYPPLSWFKHRIDTTAMDDLKRLPVCTKCQKRDLLASNYRDGVCGLCSNGLTRCSCTSCGAPLIRPPEESHVCKRCQNGTSGRSREKTPRDRKSSAESQAAISNEMSLLAKIYNALVIAVLALVLMFLGFMVFDPAGGQAAGRPMMLGILSAISAVLVGTLISNIRQRKLGVVATVLQAMALVFTCIGLPVAVIGVVAMLQDRKS